MRSDPPALPDIESRTDIEALLWAFYGAALIDPVLGPVFTIAEMDLATHLPRIASFWEVTLLGTGTYAGRPMQLHRHLAATAGLAAVHFEQWLVLWRHTLTALFDGPTATRAVGDAQRMAVGMIRDSEKPGAAEGDLRPWPPHRSGWQGEQADPIRLIVTSTPPQD